MHLVSSQSYLVYSCYLLLKLNHTCYISIIEVYLLKCSIIYLLTCVTCYYCYLLPVLQCYCLGWPVTCYQDLNMFVPSYLLPRYTCQGTCYTCVTDSLLLWPLTSYHLTNGLMSASYHKWPSYSSLPLSSSYLYHTHCLTITHWTSTLHRHHPGLDAAHIYESWR